MDLSRIPHKNLLASGALALMILGIGVYINKTPTSDKKLSVEEINIGTNNGSDDITIRDSDDDGLADWEERLYGSDPFNSDTDGDGTPDGIEVKDGRDPLKQGPNDKMSIIQDPNFATSSTDLTGLKKEFFAKYLATQSKEIRETTYRDLISGFNPKKFRPTNELTDLSITSGDDVETLRAYGNAFGLLIQKYTVRTHRTEEEILESGLQTKSDNTLKELQLPAVTYENFSKDLKKITVPSGLAKHHLLIVNGYEGMARGLMGMKVLFSNPIDGAAGYQRYTLARLDVTTGYAGVVSYFASHGVTFTSTEPGYPLYANTVKKEDSKTTSI